jgi:hypothetical protein
VKKILGCALYIMCALSIEKYGSSSTYLKCENLQVDHHSYFSLSYLWVGGPYSINLFLYAGLWCSCSYCSLQAQYSVFHVLPLFIPEMSAGFTSYIVQIIHIYFTWILWQQQFSLFPFDLIILSIHRRTMAYASTMNNNHDSLWLNFLYSL